MGNDFIAIITNGMCKGCLKSVSSQQAPNNSFGNKLITVIAGLIGIGIVFGSTNELFIIYYFIVNGSLQNIAISIFEGLAIEFLGISIFFSGLLLATQRHPQKRRIVYIEATLGFIAITYGLPFITYSFFAIPLVMLILLGVIIFVGTLFLTKNSSIRRTVLFTELAIGFLFVALNILNVSIFDIPLFGEL